MFDKIAVLIPCYNESATIAKVVRDFRNELPEATIYVYDNNSTDGTAEIAKEAGAIVRYEYKQGKGNVIRSMFRDIDAEVYLMIDGDDTYPAEHAREMIAPVLNKGAHMVVGDRLSSTYFTENKRPFHNFGNTFVRFAVNKIFKSDIQDIMTGYRAFSYEFVKTFPVISKNFEIETEMTIHAVDKNLNVANVIIDYRDRQEGSVSKLNTVQDGIKVIFTIVKMFKNYRPFVFFSVIAAFLLLLTVIFFCPVLIKYLVDGVVTRMPTLVVCGFTSISALVCWFSGLLLSTLVSQHRQNFEFNLQAASNRKKDIQNKADVNR
ncbi:MAG: glycosyltransferase [Ruminococcaceae bacterium]|nr:glycosyltransferase [Oscillospiraceae bacterium]